MEAPCARCSSSRTTSRPPGPVGEQFAARGYEVEEFNVVPEDRFHDPGVTVEFPDPRRTTSIVPMGAPWSVYDEATIGAWIARGARRSCAGARRGVSRARDLLRRPGARGGARRLGRSAPAAPEIGWYAVDTDEPGLWSPARGSSGTTTGWRPHPARVCWRAPRRPRRPSESAAASAFSSTRRSRRRSCWPGSTTAAAPTSTCTGATPRPCSPRPPGPRPTPRPAADASWTASSTRWRSHLSREMSPRVALVA